MKNVGRATPQLTELQQFLVDAIQQYVAESPLNRLRDIDGSPIFEAPLVGFADGDDPLFQQYKQVVGPFQLTPREALAASLKQENGAQPPDFPKVGVVSWILPIAAETRASNRPMKEGPSLRWNNSRFQGEDFNDSLRRHVVALLRQRGYAAVAPVVTELFNVYYDDVPRRPASTWSERHIAYAAGHGTFSLNDALITRKGIAHRCGSAVVGAEFVPSPRPYSDYREYCLHFRGVECDVCARRCPTQCIGPDGHDKLRCRKTLFEDQARWLEKPGYIGPYPGCGLCQVGTPCESRIPKAQVQTTAPSRQAITRRTGLPRHRS